MRVLKMTIFEALHSAFGSQSARAGGHVTTRGIMTEVVIMRPKVQPPLDSIATKTNAEVANRKKATGKRSVSTHKG
jgi:hypothetical protein